jgi:hypothetical protein
VIGVTEGRAFFALTAAQQVRRRINFCYRNNSLRGNCHFTLRSGMEGLKGLFVAVPQIERNCPAPTAQLLKPKSDWRDY